MRQGWHHVAQKSMTTGTVRDFWTTSWSKVSAVGSMIQGEALAMGEVSFCRRSQNSRRGPSAA